MFQRKRSKLQYLEVKGPKYNVTEEKVRITMFERIRLKFRGLKEKVQIAIFETIMSELQCFKE